MSPEINCILGTLIMHVLTHHRHQRLLASRFMMAIFCLVDLSRQLIDMCISLLVSVTFQVCCVDVPSSIWEKHCLRGPTA